MSSADLLGNAGPVYGTPTDEATKRLYRVAGLGGVGAFLAWLGQPILVFLIFGSRGDAGSDWSEIESSRYSGAIEVVIFSAIGVGLLFMVLATWRILGHRNAVGSVAAAVGYVMGLVAAVSWFLVAAEAFRMFTSIGAAIPEVTGDSGLQASIIHGTYLDITGALLLFVVGYTGWVGRAAAGAAPRLRPSPEGCQRATGITDCMTMHHRLWWQLPLLPQVATLLDEWTLRLASLPSASIAAECRASLSTVTSAHRRAA